MAEPGKETEITTSKLTAMCLKYWWFQPEHAYKAVAYKKKSVRQSRVRVPLTTMSLDHWFLATTHWYTSSRGDNEASNILQRLKKEFDEKKNWKRKIKSWIERTIFDHFFPTFPRKKKGYGLMEGEMEEPTDRLADGRTYI